MTTDPLVSVCMITYRHEAWLPRALDSVLAQELEAPWEVVVSDDGSPDATPEIVRAYARRRPDRVRALLAPENRGMMANFAAALAACRGRYVALLEGDDYWTFPGKLRRQVALLEARPGLGGCFHDAWVLHPDGTREPFHEGLAPGRYGPRDVLRSWLMPTASVVFRNPGLADLPPFFAGATHGDLALFLLLADRAPFAYLPERWSVYRRHPGGVTSGFRGVAFNDAQIRFLASMDDHFGGRYHDLLAQRIAGLHRSSALHHARQGGRSEALRALGAAWAAHRGLSARALRETAQVVLGLASPRAYRGIRRLVGGGETGP